MSATITKRLRHGNLMAEVKVTSIPDDGAWGPYLSLDDASKLERVNRALLLGDVEAASKDAMVFEVAQVVRVAAE
jgi:hypothetical protein